MISSQVSYARNLPTLCISRCKFETWFICSLYTTLSKFTVMQKFFAWEHAQKTTPIFTVGKFRNFIIQPIISCQASKQHIFDPLSRFPVLFFNFDLNLTLQARPRPFQTKIYSVNAKKHFLYREIMWDIKLVVFRCAELIPAVVY